MRQHAMFMKVGRRHLTLMMAIVTVMTPFPWPAHAEVVPPETRATEAVWEGSESAGDDEIERWWGAVGAVLCGAEIRLIRVAPAIGMNPYILAAGIGGCLLAAMDIVTST